MSKPEPTPAIQTILLTEQNKIDKTDPNGSFSINLDAPVTLNDGDAITLSKSFVDTSAVDTDFIRVENDETDITISTGLYFNDLEANPAGTDTPPWGNWSTPQTQRPHGDTYILHNQSEVNLHSFMDWTLSGNPAQQPGTGSTTPFNVQLTTIDANFVTLNTSYAPYLNIAHYVVTKLEGDDSVPAPTDPAGPGLAIQEQFMLGAFVNNVTINNKHELFYYHRSALPVQIDETLQNHVAIFDNWNDVDGKSRLGWRGIQNPNCDFPDPAGTFFRWTFISDKVPFKDGYNYFGNGGKGHSVSLQAIKFPIYTKWDSFGPDDNPGVKINYLSTAKQGDPVAASQTKNFTQYKEGPDPDDPTGGVDPRLGLNKLLTALDFPPKGFPKANRIAHKDVIKIFREGNGWGRDWHWYIWEQWVDPFDSKAQPVFDAAEIDRDGAVNLTCPSFTAAGVPIFQAFGNQDSQFAVRTNGQWQHNNLQPWQLILKPISNPTSTGCNLTPRAYTTKFSIPAGNYTYDDFAQTITDKLNTLSSPVTGLSNNPNDPGCPPNAAGYSSSYLLQSSYELMMQYDGLAVGIDVPITNPTDFPNDFTFTSVVPNLPARVTSTGRNIPAIQPQTSTSVGFQPYWVSEDGTNLFQFKSTGLFPTGADSRSCGAENFSLIYDESSNRFKILEAHTPIYIDGPILSAPQQPVVKGPGSKVLQQIVGGTDESLGFLGKRKTIDTSSGIYIFDLQPRSLWFNKLGFNGSILTQAGGLGSVQNFDQNDFTGLDATLTEAKTFPMSLTTGINRTGFFSGVDSLVQKDSQYATLPDKPLTIEVDTLVGLEGARSLVVASDDQPFYNIEISGINTQDFMGQPVNNSLIQGLVGKYYSQGNFTQSESDGIEYIHKGEPIVIKSIRTRILDTQLELEAGLGPNSAFVLTINKTK